MMKTRKLAVVTAVTTLMLVVLATVALATAPTLTVTSPGDGERLEFESFPQDLDVAGTVSRAHTEGGRGSHNLCGVKELTVTVDGEEIGYEDNVASGAGESCPTFDEWSFPWEDVEPGTYEIMVTAKTVPDQDEGTGEASVEVTQETLAVDYPAAPSVAARLLGEAGVAHRYGSGRTGGNHVADVAGHMGPGTDFDGVSKEDVGAYEEAVRSFLDL